MSGSSKVGALEAFEEAKARAQGLRDRDLVCLVPERCREGLGPEPCANCLEREQRERYFTSALATIEAAPVGASSFAFFNTGERRWCILAKPELIRLGRALGWRRPGDGETAKIQTIWLQHARIVRMPIWWSLECRYAVRSARGHVIRAVASLEQARQIVGMRGNSRDRTVVTASIDTGRETPVPNAEKP